MQQNSKIYVAGHRGMVGSAIVRKLQDSGYHNLLLRTSQELDLRNQQQVNDFFEKEQPEYVVLAAAKVGGIHANNTYRATFIYDNLIMEANVIHAAYTNKVKKLLFLGSSCIYPQLAPQPMTENALLTGLLEPTNEPYAIAKIAGIKLCEAYRHQHGCNFISAMPTNLYGKNDNYHLQNSHVLPALIRKFYEAKQINAPEVTIWGDGTALREFMYVDDLAEACVFLMLNYNDAELVNVGTGDEVTIKQLAEMVQAASGYTGALVFDTTKPNGTPRKLMSVQKLKNLGYQSTTSLKAGIDWVYNDFSTHYDYYTANK
jgi:GDP-L-fucose synthase